MDTVSSVCWRKCTLNACRHTQYKRKCASLVINVKVILNVGGKKTAMLQHDIYTNPDTDMQRCLISFTPEVMRLCICKQTRHRTAISCLPQYTGGANENKKARYAVREGSLFPRLSPHRHTEPQARSSYTKSYESRTDIYCQTLVCLQN